MRISVLIPTYNGAHKILRVLSSLEKQILMPDEVVIVVDGSTDGTFEMLKSKTIALPNLNIIYQSNSGRAKVRNKAAEFASGDLFVFVDDDMELPENWLLQHLLHHENYNGIVTGVLMNPYENSSDDFQNFKAWLNEKWNKDLPQKKDNSVLLLENPYLTANNFSIPKITFELLDGFDERLTDAEDFDLAQRAMLMNIPLYLNCNIVAWHYDDVNCYKYILRQRQYTIAHDTLILLKPDIHSNNNYRLKLPKGLKKYFFKIFSFKFWIKSVDNGIWLWLPKRIRYKLYDIIVTSNGCYFPQNVDL